MKRFKRLFALELIEDGGCYPRWYLPLYRDYDLRATVCYPIWFWPFAAFWHITRGVFLHVVHDMYYTIRELKLMERNREKRKEVKDPWLK